MAGKRIEDEKSKKRLTEKSSKLHFAAFSLHFIPLCNIKIGCTQTHHYEVKFNAKKKRECNRAQQDA